jgi:CcmD family protein
MEGSLVFLFAALTITWLLIVGYVLLLGGRLNALQRELQSLRRHDDWTDDDAPDAPAR